MFKAECLLTNVLIQYINNFVGLFYNHESTFECEKSISLSKYIYKQTGKIS